MRIADWFILLIYFVAMMAISIVIGRRQKSRADYFLAGKRMRGSLIGFSMLATQVSAVSLIGAPAFIASKQGGGLVWLQYELAVPLAMIVLILLVVPRLVPFGVTTLYEYARQRFGAWTCHALSWVFLISRGLGTAVGLYAAALVLSASLDINLAWSLLVLAGITVAYTTIGGIEADIYSDIVQLVVIFGGTLLAVCLGASLILDHAEASTVWQSIDVERLQVLSFSGSGFKEGETYSFWPMLLGGFFLYISYYGCDQSQAQRLLTACTPRHAAYGLCINGLLRFPMVLLYCSLGVVLLIFMKLHTDFAASIPAQHPDYLVPYFIRAYFPVGAMGLMVAAMLAAAMSSFDSAFNSLSAVTLPYLPRSLSGVRGSRLCTLAWGLVCTFFAYLMAYSEHTVIELINMIGSAFYGPTAAIFFLGFLHRRIGERAALCGFVTGVIVNGVLWYFAPQVSWLWWNVTGFVSAYVLPLLLSARVVPEIERIEPVVPSGYRAEVSRMTIWLAVGFMGIMLTLISLQTFLPNIGR